MAAIPQETLRTLLGRGAAVGASFVWDGARWVAGPATSAVLFESTAAGGPPTDGSPFWYVTDEWC